MNDTQRNLLIIAAIAVAALVAQPVALAIGGIGMLVNIAFIVLIGAALWIWHRNNASRISTMPAHWRYVLQASGVALYFVTVTGLLFPGWAHGGINLAIFFALTALCILGIYTAWQNRAY